MSPLLTMLKEIFRPTRKKLVYAVLVGSALTLAGLFASGLTRHSSESVQYTVFYITMPLTLPYCVVAWAGLRRSSALIFLLGFTPLYWYIIFSICIHLFPRIFGNR